MKDYSDAVLPSVKDMDMRYRYYAGEYARVKARDTKIERYSTVVAIGLTLAALVLGVVYYG